MEALDWSNPPKDWIAAGYAPPPREKDPPYPAWPIAGLLAAFVVPLCLTTLLSAAPPSASAFVVGAVSLLWSFTVGPLCGLAGIAYGAIVFVQRVAGRSRRHRISRTKGDMDHIE